MPDNYQNRDDWQQQAWYDQQWRQPEPDQEAAPGRSQRRKWPYRGHSKYLSEPAQRYNPEEYGGIGAYEYEGSAEQINRRYARRPAQHQYLPAKLPSLNYDLGRPSAPEYGLEYIMRPEERDRFAAEAGYVDGVQPSDTGAQTYAGLGPKSYKRSDERIIEHVNDLLAVHDELDANDIEVSIQDGVVTLSGTVPYKQMKWLAEDVAFSVIGVNQVKNLLHVQSPSVH